MTAISAEYLNKRDSAGINYDDILFDEVINNEGVIYNEYNR